MSEIAKYRCIQIIRKEVQLVAALKHPLSLVVRLLDYPFHLRLSKKVSPGYSTNARARNLCQRGCREDNSG